MFLYLVKFKYLWNLAAVAAFNFCLGILQTNVYVILLHV